MTNNRSTGFIIAAGFSVLFAITTILFAALWLGTKAQILDAKAETAEVRSKATEIEQEARKIKDANEQFIKVQQGQAQKRLCISQLRMIDSAKEQWAIDNRKPANAVVTMDDLVGPGKYLRTYPVCPTDGTYQVQPIGVDPICSQHGALTQ